MAQDKSNAKDSADEGQPTIFHDFMGRSCPSDSSPAGLKPAAGEANRPEVSPSASASLGPSSSGGRGLISSSSDLGSERQTVKQYEGVQFYGSRSDLTATEMSNRFTGYKRSNSDSGFMGSSRDGFPRARSDSIEGLHLMKAMRNAGGERLRRSSDDAMFLSGNQMRPSPSSLIFQPPTSNRIDVSVTKSEQGLPLNIGPVSQYFPRVGQVVSFGHQASLKRFRDANATPSLISQAAADEGSRTGIKGSGIFPTINARSGISEGNPSGILLSGSKLKFGTQTCEPESATTPPSRHGLTSPSRQMTIFYGGQAHVFDDVHPNKADVIMSLAGSNGGSWSTNFAPKSSSPAPGESSRPGGDNEAGISGNLASPWDFRRRLAIGGSSSHGTGSGNQILVPPGDRQGSGTLVLEGKKLIQAAEPRTEDKREM